MRLGSDKYILTRIECFNKMLKVLLCLCCLRCGPLIDLCRGPHVRHTGKIKAMTVTKVYDEV